MISFLPAEQFSYPELARLVALSFQDYLVPFAPAPEALKARFINEHVDLALSSVCLNAQGESGVIFIARRGRMSRIAAMALSPALRGQGLATRLLQLAIAQARTRGDGSLDLEVITHNQPALSLYLRSGFLMRRTLLGFCSSGERRQRTSAVRLDMVDIAQVITLMQAESALDLPWQVAPGSLSHLPSSARSYALERRGYAVLVPGAGELLNLRALYVPPEYRQRGVASQLLRTLCHRFPGKLLTTPVAIPAPLTPVFAAADVGFAPIALRQFEMRLSL